MGVFGGGNTCAGLIFVDNAVDFIIHATQSSIALGQAYNLRDETDETWRQYLDTLANGLGYRSAYINFNPNVALFLGQVLTGFHEALYGAIHIPGRPLITKHVVYVMSRDQGYLIDKAKRDLGFKSTISFDQGMERTLDWLYSINMEKKERH